MGEVQEPQVPGGSLRAEPSSRQPKKGCPWIKRWSRRLTNGNPRFWRGTERGRATSARSAAAAAAPRARGLHRDPGAPTHWKCFACGGYFDVLDLYGLAFGLETFPEKLCRGGGLLRADGERAAPEGRARAPAAPSRTAPPSSRPAQARLAQTDYPQRRGLSAATCARFHLGYDPAWRNPKAPETGAALAPADYPDRAHQLPRPRRARQGRAQRAGGAIHEGQGRQDAPGSTPRRSTRRKSPSSSSRARLTR